ncbi:hypothetical protein D9757_008492 [Collybiopsis confluens]|uniref:Uncharacterized protein n=1 Tax=Collybiopsis confluens TaxID=2823264 RepID=A0A8H5HFZ4_9AGAR|nr:hypothetical protein D9757_008492 [Collybiopsis confluens]
MMSKIAAQQELMNKKIYDIHDEQLPVYETPKRHIPPLYPPPSMENAVPDPGPSPFDTASPWLAPSASPSPTPTQSQRPEDDPSSRKSQSGTGIYFEETFLNDATSSNINHTAGDSVVITQNDHSHRENFWKLSADRSGSRTGREDNYRGFRRGGSDMRNVPYSSRVKSRSRASMNDEEGRRWADRPDVGGWRSYDTFKNDEEAGSYDSSRNDDAYFY